MFIDEDAECEIMIADVDDRRKGFAREALRLFLSYASSIVKPHRLIARIGKDNAPSIKLFESLGFRVVKIVEVFNQVELRFDGVPDWPTLEGRITTYA